MKLSDLLRTYKTPDKITVFNRWGEIVYRGYLSGVPSYLSGAFVDNFSYYGFYEKSNILTSIELL